MSEAEREKWESRYASSSSSNASFAPPSPWLKRWVHCIHPGRALDLAMGLGSNAIYLATQGFRVYGIDIALGAVKVAMKRAHSANLTLNALVADLDVYPLSENYFDLIVNCYYLNRSLFGTIKASLKPGGLIVIQAYVESSTDKLLKKDYLLNPQELQKAFRDLEVIAYEETETDSDEGKTGHSRTAHFCARKPDS